MVCTARPLLEIRRGLLVEAERLPGVVAAIKADKHAFKHVVGRKYLCPAALRQKPNCATLRRPLQEGIPGQRTSPGCGKEILRPSMGGGTDKALQRGESIRDF